MARLFSRLQDVILHCKNCGSHHFTREEDYKIKYCPYCNSEKITEEKTNDPYENQRG